ncbi:hypothetical protein Xinn_02360 [Xenorhabdus innexi]|uniref:Uncharacterized protein n=1 Tax=Xenorhabdus innexi TaxID=290109 RepID=A0A2G0NFQ8_9GAMM|nr:hypothetical protein Xinn_02360 [Xenorhabdus innexi]
MILLVATYTKNQRDVDVCIYRVNSEKIGWENKSARENLFSLACYVIVISDMFFHSIQSEAGIDTQTEIVIWIL